VLTLPNCKMTFVCGPVASGKTHLIKRWLERDNRHVVFDGTGEFLEDRARDEIWGNPAALYDRIRANPYYFRMVYQPGRDRTADFKYVLHALWWIDTPKLFVCDEFHEICPVSSKNDEVDMMLRYARHDKLGFVGASQRIADVHKLYTSGCRMVVLFNTHEARDLDAIEDRWRCAYDVERLRPLLHDDDSGVTRQIPQAVVIEKGKAPYIYDFQTESISGVLGSESPAAMESESDSKDDAGEISGTGDSGESEIATNSGSTGRSD
jgi:hypothetical protein